MSIFHDLWTLTGLKLTNAVRRAKMWNDFLTEQQRMTLTLPSGAAGHRVNQQQQSLIERDDANLATCIRIITNGLAWLPLQVKYKDTDQKGNVVLETDGDHWFNDLWRNPHPQHPPSEIKTHIGASLLATGNSFLVRKQIAGRRRSDPSAYSLKPKPSWLMYAKPDKDGDLIKNYVERFGMGQERTWDVDDVVHHRLYNINDPLYGRSGVEPLARSLWIEYQAEMMALSFFRNDGTPRMVFNPKDDVTPEQRAMLEQFFENRADPQDRNRLTILPIAGEIGRVQPSQIDMEFQAMRKFHRERTFGLIGIPPFLGGVMEYANYANAAIQEASFWRHTMIPLASLIAEFLTRQLLWRLETDQNYLLQFDLSQVQALRADELKQAKKCTMLVAGGIWTPNEARAMEYGLDPVDGGDELRASTTGWSMRDEGDGRDQSDNQDADKSPMIQVLDNLGISMPNVAVRRAGPGRPVQNKVTIRTRDGAGQVIAETEMDDGIFDQARKMIDDRIDYYERRLARPMKTYWRELQRRILAKLDEITIQGAYMTGLYAITRKAKVDPNKLEDFMNLAAEMEVLTRLYQPIILEIFTEIGQAEASQAIEAGGLGVDFDVRNPKIQAAIDMRLNKIARTSNTTYDDIKRILWTGYQNQLSIDEIARDIVRKFSQYNLKRATLIARTEMTGIANGASRLAWSENGATHKIWIATLDDLTRDYHVMYNGERVPIDAYFMAGPEPLMEPCDPNAQLASNVCNCRCTMVFDFDPVAYMDEVMAETELSE